MPQTNMDTARAAATLDARTSLLMGVDFVPAYRTGDIDVRDPAVLTQPAESPEPSARVAPSAPPVPSRPAASPPPKDERSRDAVQQRLDEILARYEADAPHEQFVTAHTKIVFGDGDPLARLMFIGEAPGADEDKAGIPFVGRAGQLLNKMITAMGLKREEVYIANVLKTRPPNNATPTIDEARLCAPYLYEQIAAIQPEVIVTLGLPATRLILDSTDSMGRLRGRWGEFVDPEGRAVPVMPTYHPAFLLRSYTPDNRAKVWSDLKLAMERLGLA
jgi:DNA polymerase